MPGKITGFLFNVRTHAILLYFSAFLLVSASINRDITRREFSAALLMALLIQCFYLFNKFEDAEEDAANGESPFFENSQANRRMALGLSAFTLLLCSYLFPELVPLFLWGAVSILIYRKVKRIFLLKTLVLVLNFSLTAVFAPFVINGIYGYSSVPAVLFSNLHFSIMILALTVALDIRDEKGDKAAGVRSLPAVIGAGKTFAVLTALLAVHFYFLRAAPVPVKFFNLLYYCFFLSMTWLGHKKNKKYYDFLQLFSGIFILVLAFAVSRGRF